MRCGKRKNEKKSNYTSEYTKKPAKEQRKRQRLFRFQDLATQMKKKAREKELRRRKEQKRKGYDNKQTQQMEKHEKETFLSRIHAKEIQI